GRSCRLLDNVEAVPVRVVEGEHRGNVGPAEQLPDGDTTVLEGLVGGLRVLDREPDPRVRADVLRTFRSIQRDRGAGSGRCDLDPAGRRADRRIKARLEPERVREEAECLVLITHVHADRSDVGDGGQRVASSQPWSYINEPGGVSS